MLMTTATEEPARAADPARAGIRRPASGIAIDPARLIWWRDFRAMSRQDVSDRLAEMWLAGHRDALPFSHRRARVLTGRAEPTVRYWTADGKHERDYATYAAAVRAVARLNAPLGEHRVVPVPGNVRAGCAVCGRPVTGGLTRDSLAKFESPVPEKGRRPKPRTVRALCAVLSTPDRAVHPGDLLPGGPELVPLASVLESEARLDDNEGMREFADALGRPDLYRNSSGRIFYTRELKNMWARYQADRKSGRATLAS
jgi:hypothetical protein